MAPEQPPASPARRRLDSSPRRYLRRVSTPQHAPAPDPGVPGRDDPDVATGLAVRAVTRALLIIGIAALGFGLIAAGAASMAEVESGGRGSEAVMPGLSVLMIGQLIAMVGAGLALWALIRLLRRKVPVPEHAVSGLSRALGLLARILLATVVLAVAIWVFVRPDSWLSAVLGGLVAVQIAIVIGVIRTQVLRPRA